MNGVGRKGKLVFLRGALASAAALAALNLFAGSARADFFDYVTPNNSKDSGGNPENAEADITTGNGTITITLKNLQANPTDVAQSLTDLFVTVGNGGSLTGSTLSSSAGQELTVNSGGTFTLGSTVAAGWVYSTSSSTQLLLNDLGAGGAGPAHSILGGPDGGNGYSAANGSIAGNNAHNPFLNQSASFTIGAPGVTSTTSITGVIFSFGTVSGDNIVGTRAAVPEPTSLALMGIGLGSAGLVRVIRRRRAARLAPAANC
jgi:hypothetical protein